MNRTGRIRDCLYTWLSCGQYFCTAVVITGHAKSYADSELEFMHIADWITGGEEPVGSCVVSDSGDFRLALILKLPSRSLCILGYTWVTFMPNPAKIISLCCLKRRTKNQRTNLNPYFKPEEIHLGLVNFNQDELNMLIIMFEDAYVPYYEKHVSHIYSKTDIQKLETDIQNMEAPFQKYTGDFFTEFRSYRYGMLKLFANQQKVQSLVG